jgi:protein TonB
MPKVSRHTEQNPADQKAEVTNSTAAPAATASGDTHATAAVITSPKGEARVGSFNDKGLSRGNMYASSCARAIVRPMPQIPDDLREDAFNSVALARFQIAVDGSVKVELAKPTPNSRLNKVLLNSLRKWRFMPAIKNGKPVESTEEIVVKIEVR